MTPDLVVPNYRSLGEIELIKKANDEYELIHQHDRMDYSRAITIGEVLNELKDREIVPHGKWQGYLKSKCPKISTETANRYMRIAKPDNQAKIKKAVDDKSVVATDLTIAWAEQFLAKKKQPKQTKAKTPEPPSGGVEPNSGGGAAPNAFEEELKTRDPDELLANLKGNWDEEKLQKLEENILEKTTPDELFPYLKNWDVDELKKLHALIGEHIAELSKQSGGSQIVTALALCAEPKV